MLATNRAFGLFSTMSLVLACATQGTSAPPETTPVAETAPVVEPRVAPTVPETTAQQPAPARRMPPPRTEAECKACNGAWGIHGITQTPSCNCRTSDGGKRCRDGAECEGLCAAADDPERDVVDRGPPARGFFVGRCSEFSAIFGCYRPIEDGAGTRPVDLTEPPQMICAD